MIQIFSTSYKRKKKRHIDDYEFNHIKKSKQDEVDRILDKINKSGMKSLTKSELKFLEEYKKSL